MGEKCETRGAAGAFSEFQSLRPPEPRLSFRRTLERAHVVGAFILFCILAFQARTTLRVWRSKLFDSAQKSAQTKLIWLLPLIGAVLVQSVLEDEDRREKGPPPGLGR